MGLGRRRHACTQTLSLPKKPRIKLSVCDFRSHPLFKATVHWVQPEIATFRFCCDNSIKVRKINEKMKLKILAEIGGEKSPQSQQMKNHSKVGYRADGEG